MLRKQKGAIDMKTLDTFQKGALKMGCQIWYTSIDGFDVMDFEYIRVFANVKPGEGRKVLIKKADDIEWTVCKSQKEAIRWLEENK